MGLKKKIGKILGGAGSLVDEEREAGKLKKKSAFKEFLAKLEKRQGEVEKRLAGKKLSDSERKTLEKQQEQLEKGLKKGRKLLDDL